MIFQIAIGYFERTENKMAIIIVLVIILALIIGGIAWVVGVQNNLVRLKQQCKEDWSNIDVQMQRRFDLIPNLVETVKGYAKHESSTLAAVINARNAGMNALKSGNVKEAANADKALTVAVNALTEAYPQLQANQNYLALQEELTTTENQLAFARQTYNKSTSSYNTAIQMFPSSIIANTLNFHECDMFEIDNEEARTAPKVSF